MQPASSSVSQSVVALLVVVGLGREQRDREQDAGEHHQEQRDAVDAEVELDVERRRPRCGSTTNWKPGSLGLELDEHPQREGAGGARR